MQAIASQKVNAWQAASAIRELPWQPVYRYNVLWNAPSTRRDCRGALAELASAQQPGIIARSALPSLFRRPWPPMACALLPRRAVR